MDLRLRGDDDGMRRSRPPAAGRPNVMPATSSPCAGFCLPLRRRLCLRCKDGGGRNATGLARPWQGSTRPPDRRAKSDGVPRWACLSRALPVAPTRCVQRLGPGVECAERLADARSKPRTHRPPPSLRRRQCLRHRGRRGWRQTVLSQSRPSAARVAPANARIELGKNSTVCAPRLPNWCNLCLQDLMLITAGRTA